MKQLPLKMKYLEPKPDTGGQKKSSRGIVKPKSLWKHLSEASLKTKRD